jgi:gluconolactonase
MLARVMKHAAIAAFLGLSVAGAQTPNTDSEPRPFSITRSDPGLDAIIAPDAQAKTVASGFGFIDGPVWIKGRDGKPGYLLVSSIIDNVVYKVTSEGKVSVFLDKAGYTGTDFEHEGKITPLIGRAHVLLMGPACTDIDPQGRLIWCAGQDRALMRLEKDGTRTTLTNNFQGKRFNGVDDVAITKSGAIYFTDLDIGLRGGIDGGLAQLPNAVWLWQAGKVTQAVDPKTLDHWANGIALSPDDKYLYLTSGIDKIMRYPLKADGSTGAAEVFTQGPGIGDGMKTDPKGNLFSTGAMSPVVRITSPAGKLLGLLNLPTSGDVEPRKSICASAMAFGGDDAKTLYITGCDSLFAIPLKSPGKFEGPAQ